MKSQPLASPGRSGLRPDRSTAQLTRSAREHRATDRRRCGSCSDFAPAVVALDMKTLAALVRGLAATFGTQCVSAADNAERPAGIEERNWIPISERLGFVVLAQKPPPGRITAVPLPSGIVSAELMPPEKGYFVVKTSMGWRRLVVTDASDVTG